MCEIKADLATAFDEELKHTAVNLQLDVKVESAKAVYKTYQTAMSGIRG